MDKKLLNLLIIATFVLAFILTPISLNQNGLSNALEIIKAALSPDLSIVPKALEAGFITLMYAAASIAIAIFSSIMLSFVAAGLLTTNKIIQKVVHNSFIIARSIHELIWALCFVTIFGLKPIAAILALSIPYMGMLGKVFTDIFMQIPQNNISHLKQSGASKLQVIVFGYLPETFPQLVSYSIYRFECAIRSSTILGFVGIAGLGLKIQLTLNDLRFNAMFTYIYMLIFIIVLVEIWSQKYRSNQLRKVSPYIVLGLFISSSYYLFIYEGVLFDPLLTQKNLQFAINFFKDLIGIQSNSIAYLNGKEIITVLYLALQTLQMSIVALGLAVVGMMLTIVTSTKSMTHPIVYYLSRGILLITRAVPELIWAFILIFIFKPGIWVGALALGIHNYGILTKLCSESVEGLPTTSLKSMANTGSSPMQIFLFGIIPSVLQRLISFSLYRFEIITRTTIVVGMAGTAGLGYYFKLHFSWFHYTHLTLIILVYLMLVKATDLISKYLNRKYAF